MNADGSVVIGVSLTTKEADQELARLKKKILRLKEDIDVKEFKHDSLVEQLKQAQKELDKLQKQTGTENTDRVSELKDEIKSLTSEAKRYEKELNDANLALEGEEGYYKRIYDDVVRVGKEQKAQSDAAITAMYSGLDKGGIIQTNPAAEQAQSFIDKVGELDEAEKLSRTFIDRVRAIFSEGAESVKAVFSQMWSGIVDRATSESVSAEELARPFSERLQEALTSAKDRLTDLANSIIDLGFKAFDSLKAKILDFAKQSISALKSFPQKGVQALATFAKKGLHVVAAGAGNAARSLAGLFRNTKTGNDVFASGLKTLLKYGIGIRSLYVLFNKLRAAVTEGFKNLAQFSDSTNKSLSSVKSALTQLKNSLATAFAPIIETIAPIITQFVNMLSEAANKVAMLGAALAGKNTYSKAVAVQEEYAKSLENTGESADEASKAMASFDKINVLATKDAKKASGGAATPAEMFEEVAINPVEIPKLSFNSWGEAFSAMLSEILDKGIPRLRSGLNALADWVNVFATRLAAMFKFPGIVEKIAELGRRLAEAINGFVNKIPWEKIGEALGAGLNLAITFLLSALKGINWRNIGDKLAIGINTLLEEIDGKNLGELLWQKFRVALELLTGFILGLSMPLLAKTAGDTIIGFFDAMTDTLESIPWVEIANQLALFLNELDWEGILTSVGYAISTAFNSVIMLAKTFLENVNWREIGEAVGKFFTDMIEDVDWAGLGETLGSLVVAVFDLIDGFLDRVKWEDIGGAVGEFITNMINKVDWIAIGDTLSDFIVDVFKFIKGGLKKVDWEGIGDKIAEFLCNIDWLEIIKTVVSAMWTFIKSAADLLWGFLKGIWSNVTDLIKGKSSSSADTSTSGGNTSGRNVGVSTQNIPHYATGAVIPPNREFLAVLGDQKTGTNIETPLATMLQAFKEALAQSGCSGKQPVIENVLMLDSEVLYRSNQQAAIRHGNNFVQGATR